MPTVHRLQRVAHHPIGIGFDSEGMKGWLHEFPLSPPVVAISTYRLIRNWRLEKQIGSRPLAKAASESVNA